MATNVPQWLRCSLVWEHTLLDERYYPTGRSVRIGEAHSNDFTLRAEGLGKRFTLLRAGRTGPELNLRPGFRGQVIMHGRSRTVEDLLADREGLAERRGDVLRYSLGEGDSGVLVFGRTGLAFDLVTASAGPPPPSLTDLLGIDRVVSRLFGGGLALILMLVFTSRLFGAGSPDFTVEQLPERFVSFVIEDPHAAAQLRQEARKLREEERRRDEERQQQKKERPENRPTARPEPAPERAPEASPEDAERRRIRDKVATKGLVAAMGEARKSNRSLARLLDESGLGSSLDRAMRDLERGRARVIGSTGSTGMAAPLGHARTSTDAVGQDVRVAGPATGQRGRAAGAEARLTGRGEARLELSMPAEAAKVTGGTLSRKQIADVVMKNKGSIRYCYESQLNRFPTLRGKLEADFIIELDGSVKTVNITNNGLSNRAAGEQVASCLTRFVRRWRFPPPQGGKVRVIYPFSFGRST
jgi:hypothetical protein